ncbi:hypothetical protein E2C01_025225 [Portunus trituberculatus]|uniref:Uncharacterized protein n=1 Tax=Portunus trituberculatus TaxID=210409 RepID=A0A5B7EEV9_PORTR|nr:hypothetical protein [Portunus trituberculatus]
MHSPRPHTLLSTLTQRHTHPIFHARTLLLTPIQRPAHPYSAQITLTAPYPLPQHPALPYPPSSPAQSRYKRLPSFLHSSPPPPSRHVTPSFPSTSSGQPPRRLARSVSSS